jgi:hypothetical protein
MMAGQSPRMQWRANADGKTRTIDEAKEIARRHGVVIPEDVHIAPDQIGDLGAEVTARGPRVDKLAGSIVYWSDMVHDKTGKVPFRIRPDIFDSDEAIVAVFAHEMYELEQMRPLLLEGKTTIEEFIAETCPGNPGNFHDEAWEVADRLVERMRQGETP